MTGKDRLKPYLDSPVIMGNEAQQHVGGGVAGESREKVQLVGRDGEQGLPGETRIELPTLGQDLVLVQTSDGEKGGS